MMKIEGNYKQPLDDLDGKEDDLRYVWVGGDRYDICNGLGEILNHQTFMIPEDVLVLDIDLDAFCCQRSMDFTALDDTDRNITDYVRRINETGEFLKRQRKPNLITIARSQGQTKQSTYVPPDLVNQVQDCLIQKLEELYST